jgi:CBS domain containing-hemolysin-like protein
MPLLLILAALVLIFLNALWVIAEFAIVRVRRTRLEELAGQGVDAAKSAIVVVDKISDYLALTQIGITVASLAVGWLADSALTQLLRLVRRFALHIRNTHARVLLTPLRPWAAHIVPPGINGCGNPLSAEVRTRHFIPRDVPYSI